MTKERRHKSRYCQRYRKVTAGALKPTIGKLGGDKAQKALNSLSQYLVSVALKNYSV
jgi:hypothetical protein